MLVFHESWGQHGNLTNEEPLALMELRIDRMYAFR
jgi:hypothetical protein